ncbi:MAG: hypothetical protein QOI21_6222 [Actinomycetota bacterium]|jgi:hypothetical protein|nr:hypothetical protein [Actinomycetota bacterium]
MRRRQRLQLMIQLTLVLVASLMGIATNYATEITEAPFVLRVLRQVAIPGIGLLIVVLIVGHVVVYRLERPSGPRWVVVPVLTPGSNPLGAFAAEAVEWRASDPGRRRADETAGLRVEPRRDVVLSAVAAHADAGADGDLSDEGGE